MEFDKSKVYTALNADELKEGSIVVAANDVSTLKNKVALKEYNELFRIWGTSSTNRFEVFPIDREKTERYNLCYLISELEEKKLKWTDLKIGDIVRCISNKNLVYMVTAIDSVPVDNETHIMLGGNWINDYSLFAYEKVE